MGRALLRCYLLVVVGAMLTVTTSAQSTAFTYVSDTSVKVFAGANQRSAPWMGGLTIPQFAMADLNKDGKTDLVIYEQFGDYTVKTFLNRGTPGSPYYVYAPKYAKNFPPVYYYLKLQDYNCDGIPDLFHRGAVGIEVWRGRYTTANELTFDKYKELWYPDPIHPGSTINAYVEPTDIPSFVDVDNDGDLDFLAFAIQGSQIYWYKNYQKENNLPCDSIQIKIRSSCWGKTQQSLLRKATMGYSCGIDSLGRPPGDVGSEGSTEAPLSKTTLHGGNTLCMFDIDGDGDYDYLNGNFAFNDIQLLINGKAQYGGRDSIVSQDTVWQANGKKFDMPSFPAAFNIDYDGDGKKDIVIAPHAGSASKNWNQVWWYRNIGSVAAPQFQFAKDSLFYDNSIDAGSDAHPVFYDFDKDGKQDLIIGSSGVFQNNGTTLGKLQYFRNISTANNPKLQFITEDLGNISGSGGQGAVPAFGDVDGDGKDDLIVGRNDGTLSYFKNTAPTALSTPVLNLLQLNLKDSSGVTINVGGYASPVLYDLDKDGRKDLIIGRQSGSLYYYRNVSPSPGVVAFKFVDDSLGQAYADGQSIFPGFSAPYIGKIDNTPKEYLLMGSNSGALYLYDGLSSANTALPYNLLSSNYASIKPASRTAPAIADIDGNGTLEMVVGGTHGGLFLYKSSESVGVAEENSKESYLQVSPNPASEVAEVRWPAGSGTADVRLIDVTGRIVSNQSVSASLGHYVLSVASLPPGVYVVTVMTSERLQTARLVIAK